MQSRLGGHFRTGLLVYLDSALFTRESGVECYRIRLSGISQVLILAVFAKIAKFEW